MLLQRFCNEKGRLWVGDRDDGNVFQASVSDAFAENYLYAFRSYADDSKSMEHEARLGQIESAAAPVLSKVVVSVGLGRVPDLSAPEREALKRFVFSLARRTPESQARVAASDDGYEVFYRAAFRQAAQIGHPPLPPKEELLADDRIRVIADKVLHNVDADFAAGDDNAISAEQTKFIGETGLHYGRLIPSGPELVIGSHGVTIHDAGEHDDKRLWLGGTVLPVAPHALMNITDSPERDFLTFLGAGTDPVVHSINQATVSLSRWIGGRSETVVRSALESAGC